MYLQLLLVGLVLASGLEAQGTKGRKAAASEQKPFYGTKGKQAAASEQQEQEAALPAFIEPPPSPNPEPDNAGPNEPGMPYSFAYTAEATNGMSARSETSDGNVVKGSYMLKGPDGLDRVVHYIADKDGFRARIETNEPGTETMNPAGVELYSSQQPASEIALQYGPGEPARQAFASAPAQVLAPAVPAFKPAPIQAPVFNTAPIQAPIAVALSQPSSFGFRQDIRHEAAPSLRSSAIKGAAPTQARKTLVLAPVAKRPSFQTPVVQFRAPVIPVAPVVTPIFRAPVIPVAPLPTFVAAPQVPRPFFTNPLPAGIPPAPRPVLSAPLPVARSSGKQTLTRNPTKFYEKPTTTTTTTTEAPQVFYDEQEQQQEEEAQPSQEQQQQQEEEEPEVQQEQQQQQLLDEPQQEFFN
ncbi:Cuticle protein 16.8 [Halotydeus destructor]|nr:Cuticle protein 16.8 [Halotydeus destructor]